MGVWDCFRGDPDEKWLVGFARTDYLFRIAFRLHLLLGLPDRLQPLERACVQLLTLWSHAFEISLRVQALLRFAPAPPAGRWANVLSGSILRPKTGTS